MTSSLPRLLIVDDEPLNIKILVDLLRADYALLVAKNGDQALERMSHDPVPDLVLMDVMMPGMDGYEVCRRLKADPRTADVPVIFCSAMSESDDETKGFEVGGVDYVTKPISPPVVKARLRTHLTLRQARTQLENHNRQLEVTVAQRTKDVIRTQDVTIRALASLAETRDNETGNHVRRTQHYVRVLAETLCHHPRFKASLTPQNIELIFKSAPLHDVGKVGIPDAILLKPGRLTSDEFTIMKRHAELGRQALQAALDDEEPQALGEEPVPQPPLPQTEDSTAEFLRFACEIAGSHHEKWDGSGYPEGLVGDAIPVSARLMAVADVYDALICRRVYKPAFTHEDACEIIKKGHGSHFDPDITDAFLQVAEQFRSIAQRFADEDDEDIEPR